MNFFYIKYTSNARNTGIKVQSDSEIRELLNDGYVSVSEEEFSSVAFDQTAFEEPAEPSAEADLMQMLLDQECRLTLLELSAGTAEI